MKTVRVRIAVAVDADGCWNAGGWSTSKSEAAMRDVVLDTFEPHGLEHVVFVEADVPLPEEPPTVKGQVAHE